MNNILRSDTVIKIVSVLVAIVLWAYVIGEQNPFVEHTFRDVPIQFNNLEDIDYALVEDESSFKINVRVKTRRSYLAKLTKDMINAEVNMRGRIEGENLLPITIILPEQAELVSVNPTEIMVTLEPIIERQIPVTVRVHGEPADGFAIMEPIIKPAEAILNGPKSIVETIKSAFISVDVSGRSEDVKGDFLLRVTDEKSSESKKITYKPEIVEALVPIVKKVDVEIEPNIIGKPNEGYTISGVVINPSMISVTGDEDVISNLQKIRTETINLNDVKEDVHKEVKVILPTGVELVTGEKDIINITVRIGKIEQHTLNTIKEVNFINLIEGYEVSADPVDISVSLKGLKQDLNRIKEEDINVHADLKGLQEGTHEVKLSISIPDNVTLGDFYPKHINIEIKRGEEI